MLREPTATEVNGRTVETMAKDIAEIKKELTKDTTTFVNKIWLASFWGCLFVILSVITWTILVFLGLTVFGISLGGLASLF